MSEDEKGLTCNWVFTENAIPQTLEEQTDPPLVIHDDSVRGYYYQLEKAPSTGHLHLQGFICFKTNQRLSAVKKILPTARLAPMKGRVTQNIKYCSKSDTKLLGPWKVGELPERPGKRTDCATVLELYKAKAPVETIYTEVPSMMDHPGRLDALADVFDKPPHWRNVKVAVLYGITETHKTRRATEWMPDSYYMVDHEKNGFDEYRGEDILIVDDFNPAEWCVTTVKRMLDGYKYCIPCRFHNKWARWTKIIITSNYAPYTWYEPKGNEPRESYDAIQRRIPAQNCFEVHNAEEKINFDEIFI